jgi:hypothetical protein
VLTPSAAIDRRYRITIASVGIASLIGHSCASAYRASVLGARATPELLLGLVLLLPVLSAWQRSFWIRTPALLTSCVMVAWVIYTIVSIMTRSGGHLEFVFWDCVFVLSFGVLLLPLEGWSRVRGCSLLVFLVSLSVLEYEATKRATHRAEVREATGVMLTH